MNELLWPAHCLVCLAYLGEKLAEGVVSDFESHDGTDRALVCASCRKQILGLNKPQCYRCGAPAGDHETVWNGDRPAPCLRCRKEHWATDTLIRLCVYRGVARRVCLKCKRPGGEQLTTAICQMLLSRHRELFMERKPDLIVPVPPFWLRRIWSHDHPAEVMARTLSRLLRVPQMRFAVRRRRLGQRQKRLSPAERRRNVSGHYRVVHPSAVAGTRILLVDDIVTSGATVNEVARVLRESNASRIDVATLARGLPARINWRSSSATSSPARNRLRR